MGKILQFRPRTTELKENASEQDYDIALECVDVAVHLFNVLEDEIISLNSPYSKDINFDDPDNPTARDMYVIINLLSSMLIRHNGINHLMHPYLDDLYEILVERIGG